MCPHLNAVCEHLNEARVVTRMTLAWFRPIAAEVHAIAEGPAPHVSVGTAVAVSVGLVAAGNGVVALGERLSGDARELATTALNSLVGFVGVRGLLASGWRRTDLGLVQPSWQGDWRLAAILVTGGAVAAIVGTVIRGGIYRGSNARVTILRLVVGTALGEEVVHRAVLFPLWAATRRSPLLVIAANGVTFGAWHLASVVRKGWTGRLFGVIGPATAGAAMFVWARCHSGSLAGASLLHLVTNLPGVVAAVWRRSMHG